MSEFIAKCSEVVGISGKALIVPEYIDTSKEIVRCRDCERFDDRWAYCNYFMEDIEPDGFCKWGEHK